MPAFGDFGFAKWEDGVLYVQMAPPVAIGGMSFQATITKRFGGTPIFIGNMASGFYGVSGMNIVNSGAGQMSVQIPAWAMSGYDPGNYACQVKRMDSGLQTVNFQGYFLLQPGDM